MNLHIKKLADKMNGKRGAGHRLIAQGRSRKEGHYEHSLFSGILFGPDCGINLLQRAQTGQELARGGDGYSTADVCEKRGCTGRGRYPLSHRRRQIR